MFGWVCRLGSANTTCELFLTQSKFLYSLIALNVCSQAFCADNLPKPQPADIKIISTESNDSPLFTSTLYNYDLIAY